MQPKRMRGRILIRVYVRIDAAFILHLAVGACVFYPHRHKRTILIPLRRPVEDALNA
jgi:hypothetical protein